MPLGFGMVRGRMAGRWLGLSALAGLGAVAAALVSQHVFDMQPCPWCVLQRLIFLCIALVCAVGWAVNAVPLRRALAGLALLLALCGVAAALWQHFKAAASASCNLTLADKIVGSLHLNTLLPSVFEARASCADAAVNLLGVPYDFWALALFAYIALAALQAVRVAAGR